MLEIQHPWGLSPRLDAIPDALRGGRWCVWRAEPRKNKAGKVDKIPYSTNAKKKARLSTREPSTWGAVEDAAILLTLDGYYDGVGRLVEQGEIWLDLDNCFVDGELNDHAQRIVDRVGGYVEISPSGTGLRIFGKHDMFGPDFCNHASGVEFYGGSAPRFVTITGHVLSDTPFNVEQAKRCYNHFKPAEKPETPDVDRPELLDVDDVPQRHDLRLELKLIRQLCDGFDGADRSRDLQILTKNLYSTGYDDQTVYSILCSYDGPRQVALDHRKQKDDKAEDYLWKQCLDARHAAVAVEFDNLEDEEPDTTKGTFKGLMDLAELDGKMGPISWLVKDFLETDCSGVLFGDPEVYKSFAALDLALCVAYGLPWHGHDVEQGAVIYVAGEGFNGLARRVRAWRKEHDVMDVDAPFFLTRQAVPLTIRESANELVKIIDPIVKEHGKPAMIVSDTLARNFGPGDESSSTDMNMYIAHTDGLLRRRYGAVMLTVHHTGHGNKERARGSMALHGAADFEYRLDRENATTVRLVCTKMKDAPKPRDTYFEAREVVVGAFDGEAATSLVLDTCAAPVEEVPALKGKQLTLFETIKKEAPIDRETLRNIVLGEKLFDTAQQLRRTLDVLKQKDYVIEIEGVLSVEEWADE